MNTYGAVGLHVFNFFCIPLMLFCSYPSLSCFSGPGDMMSRTRDDIVS
jgi:hypothetical protein